MFAIFTDQIIGGGVLVAFMWVIMITIPSNLYTSFSITHNLSNFFSYNTTNFNRLYRSNEIYEVFDKMIPSFIWVGLVGTILANL